jgi:hypothetical protein
MVGTSVSLQHSSRKEKKNRHGAIWEETKLARFRSPPISGTTMAVHLSHDQAMTLCSPRFFVPPSCATTLRPLCDASSSPFGQGTAELERTDIAASTFAEHGELYVHWHR